MRNHQNWTETCWIDLWKKDRETKSLSLFPGRTKRELSEGQHETKKKKDVKFWCPMLNSSGEHYQRIWNQKSITEGQVRADST